MKSDYWKLFEETGSISAYLNYACTSEESQSYGREEGGHGDEPGDRDRNGFISHANWRLR